MLTLTREPSPLAMGASASAPAPAPGWVAQAARAIWRTLEREGHRRAASELRRLAQAHAMTDPARARQFAAAAADASRAAA